MSNYSIKGKRILLIIPNLNFGGAQRCFSKLTQEFSKNNQVNVCVFNTELGIAFPYGGRLISLDIPAGNTYLKKVLYFFKRIIKVRKIKKNEKIDLSISYLEGANYINILSKRKEKIVISIRGSQVFDETIGGIIGNLRKRYFIPFIYKFADKVVALNKGIKKELEDIFLLSSEKVTVIYNFYNIEEITLKAQEEIEENYKPIFEGNVVITAGRLEIEKGYHHLIEVAAVLKKRSADIKFVVIGDGSLRSQLVELARGKSLKVYSICDKLPEMSLLDYDFYFLGYKENPFKYISRSTLFTITSSSEGGPNILNEALICGTPVMSADCPSGPREKLTARDYYSSEKELTTIEYGEYGILMPTFQLAENKIDVVAIWADAIGKVVMDIHLRSSYSLKGKQRMLAFSVENIFKEWEEVVK